MASLWDYLLGARQEPEPTTADATSVAQLQETLVHQEGFNEHVSALASRTALAPEDVMAESVRFANRHAEAFNDFIYKGQIARSEGERASTRQINNIVAMMFLLVLLIALIVILGTTR